MPEIHLRLVRLDDTARSYRPVADGARVRLVDVDLLFDDVLAEAETRDGQVSLSLPARGLPDIFFHVTEPDGATWSTRFLTAWDGTPGYLRNFEPRDLGTAACL